MLMVKFGHTKKSQMFLVLAGNVLAFLCALLDIEIRQPTSPNAFGNALKHKAMQVNEHGLECPISWDKIPDDHYWIATDWDGITCSFKSKPEFLNDASWFGEEPSWGAFVDSLEVPIDASKCLWRRPKISHDAG